MMTKDPPASPTATWPIQDHTRAKLALLRFYLNAWFPILSQGGFARIVYVDGFAGPGRYSGGEEGSPLVALNAVLSSKLLPEATFEFHFVDSERQYLERLRYEIDLLAPALGRRRNIIIRIHEKRFDDAYRLIAPRLGSDGTKVPTFALLDPFGWTGAPFEIVRDLLVRPSTEVVINFMREEISRFLAHDQQPENFDILFGCRTWRSAVSLRGYERTYRLHDLYRDQLRNVAGARYVRSFTMVNQKNRVDYFLFFATNNFLGLKKMKEAMWRVDPAEGSQFSDATDPNTPSLFGQNPNVGSLRRALRQKFGESWTPVDTLFRFTESETPFLTKHAREVLRAAECAVAPTGEMRATETRRRGTFPEHRGIEVKFR